MTVFEPFSTFKKATVSMAESISESPQPVADTDTDEYVPILPCEASPKGDNCKLDSLVSKFLVYTDFVKSRINEPYDNGTTPGGLPCDSRQPELITGAVMYDYQVFPHISVHAT